MKEKKEVIILKPNTLRSKHSPALSLNEQRILFYSIYKIQTSATSVTFTKTELSERFGVDFGSFKDVSKYLIKLRSFGMDTINEKTDKIEIVNAFSELSYDNGVFTFKFNQNFLPTINKQKRFLQYAMSGIENFKVRYSIYLYDFLKDYMWGEISVKKDISLTEFRSIFKLEKNKYTENKNFKLRVWQPAMEEINKYTNYKINITTKGKGNAMRFSIYRVVNEDLSQKPEMVAPEFVCGLGKNLIDSGCRECMRINKCPFAVDNSFYLSLKSAYPESPSFVLSSFMEDILWSNRYYSLTERIKNNCASSIELAYYNRAIDTYKRYNDALALDREFSIEEAINSEREFHRSRIASYDEDYR